MKERPLESTETHEERLERARRILREAEIELGKALKEIRDQNHESTIFKGVVGAKLERPEWPSKEAFREAFASGPTMQEIQEEVRQRMQVKLPDSVINAPFRIDH